MMDILRKAGDLLWDSTIGLLKAYQDKTVELAKIEAVSFYVKGVQVVRKHLILLILVIFSLMMLAAGLLVVPIVLILCAPWTMAVKAAVVFVFGAIYLAVPGSVLFHVFSEKRWMQVSMADEWMNKVANHKS